MVSLCFMTHQSLKRLNRKSYQDFIHTDLRSLFEGGLQLIVKWLFPKGNHKNGEYRIIKPDTDNLQKMLKDCMTKSVFWKDDALVCSEVIEKFWAEQPGIYIRIEEIQRHID